jgi:hypothetical protein
MKIAVLHSTLTPAHAAPCHFLRAAANGLIAQGHAVEFIPTTRWKRAPFHADAFVVWSAKNAASVVEVFPDARMIVMERGYYRDRNERCRIGKGAFGAALLEIAPETPERFFRYWGMPLPPRAAFRPLRSDVLLLAARQLVRCAPGRIGQPHQIQHLTGAGASFFRRQVMNAKCDVVADIEVRKQRVILKHHADATRFGCQMDPAGAFAEDLAVDGDSPGAQMLQPGHRPQQGSLATTRRPDQDADLTR